MAPMAPMPWTTNERVLRIRHRSKFANTLVLAIDRFRNHRTGRHSALITHYGFLSVFPLMLVFTTILGFVLEDNPELQAKIIDSTVSQIPLIGDQLANDPTQLQGSVFFLLFGLATATWSGLRAFNVIQTALDDIAEVPPLRRPTLLVVRRQSLVGILLVGGSQIATAVLTGFVSAAGVSWVNRLLLVVGSIALNFAVVAATYHWLCSKRPPWPTVVPGALFSGFVFTVLQLLGTGIMTRAIIRASPIYGTFATVIGLLFWISLHSMTSLLGAEMNGLLPMRRYVRDEDAATDAPSDAP